MIVSLTLALRVVLRFVLHASFFFSKVNLIASTAAVSNYHFLESSSICGTLVLLSCTNWDYFNGIGTLLRKSIGSLAQKSCLTCG